MRPELEEVKLLEEYLRNRLPEKQRQEVEIRLLWDKAWQQHLYTQKQAYLAVRQEGRRQLRQELKAIHTRLFSR